jgi:hypothetical protein
MADSINVSWASPVRDRPPPKQRVYRTGWPSICSRGGSGILIVMVMPLSALTGRMSGHSTAGLAVVPATVLSLANLGEVVREREA